MGILRPKARVFSAAWIQFGTDIAINLQAGHPFLSIFTCLLYHFGVKVHIRSDGALYPLSGWLCTSTQRQGFWAFFS